MNAEILYHMADILERRGQSKDSYLIREAHWMTERDRADGARVGSCCVGGAYALASGLPEEKSIGHFLDNEGPHPVLDLINAAVAALDGVVGPHRYHGYNSNHSEGEVVKFLRHLADAEAAYEQRLAEELA